MDPLTPLTPLHTHEAFLFCHGKINKLSKYWVYEVEFYKSEYPYLQSMCPENALTILRGYVGFDPETMAWGYVGLGPDIFSVYALRYVGFREQFSYYSPEERLRIRKWIKENARKFTIEVSSKLGDEFVLTPEEIIAWIKQNYTPDLPLRERPLTCGAVDTPITA